MEEKQVDQGAEKSREPLPAQGHRSGQGDGEPAVVRSKGYRAALLLLFVVLGAVADHFVDGPRAISPYAWAALGACALIYLYARKS